ncbi:MAG: hypothetical protein A2X54_07135 [Nitrospirae bacterium GWF2_44_13]|nr:MAG: hypothetical protein A2X54_07135 [Nitrospirae bacterium GWF2_44_13]OGW34306.1 MAG: hypothetical protein A2088_01860 [Nitrospirae bacterium GWD2_44_7]OGW64828.1 MAG: hypothetical protein A2222_04595 [Nitrospirae bacterium RIFOXYA2_FULL_44_9]HBU06238.1 hypothetical protein [Nitrospiraceae bacterium]
MTIETGLLVLESVLLLATIILLLFSLKEGRGRKNLLLQVERATKVLSRQEYFLSVTDSMMDAKKEVIGCITGRLPIGEDKKRTRNIIDTIEKLTKEGVRVRYLMPKFFDRLHIGYLYMKAGAEIRYSSCLMAHNIRFIIVDDRIVVIGIPDSIGEKEATKKGYRIPSEGLAMILKDYFNKCGNQISFVEYLEEVIKQTGATPKHLAQELQIDETELEKFTHPA